MTINTYPFGTTVRCHVAFNDSAGDPYNPSTVTIYVRRPGGAVTAYVYGVDAGVIRDSTGRYHVDVLPDVAGRWRYRGAGTVTGTAADEHEFHVEDSMVVSS